MLRVNKANPCPVCGKPDWCLYTKDGSVAICSRIEEGSVKRCGDAGWLYVLSNRHNRHNGHRKRYLTLSMKDQSGDFGQLSRQYQQQLTDNKLRWLSVQLGISAKSLKRLRLGWDGKAFTFGMSNDFGKITGIRRRFPNGNKVSLKGSKTGLFIPIDLENTGSLLITEGPSDTAAALDLGFDAVGRPNCNSRVNMTVRFAKKHNAVILGDNDKAGRAGAERLSDTLVLYCKDVRIVYPPEGIKDLRDWLSIGLNAEKLKDVIGNTKPVGIKISFNKK